MKNALRLLTVFALLLSAGAAAAQGTPTSHGSSEQWREVEKLLGLETTYSVDMVISAMGMNMDSRVYRDGERSRTEMTMPFMNLKMAVLEIPEGGKTVSYSLFPEKKKFMINEDDGEDGGSSAAPKIEDLGSETFEGIACSKRRVVMTEGGIRSEMTLLLSPKHKNMPVKMSVQASVPMEPGQPAMPLQTTILFRNYEFSKPNPELFRVPADYAKVGDMMEILMGGGSEGFGALLQQMQMQMGE